MGKVRGKPDGTGPHPNSWQKKNVGVGRKQKAGLPCPKAPAKKKKR